MPKRTLMLPAGLDGQRLDSALSRLLGLSRSQIGALIQTGDITVDGREVSKSARASEGQLVEATLPDPKPAGIVPTPIGMTVVAEDDDIIVIDKPVGVAAHSGPGWDGPTVTGALLAAGHRVATSGPPERTGIVHRLDVGTSGVMVVAKTERAYTFLKNEFRYRRVEKTYHALAQGHVDPLRGTIDAPIGRHPSRDFKMGVVADGKPAITHYDTLELMPTATLLNVTLETGRTHQIRVHMQALGHPLVGDPTYGGDPRISARLGLERQWLHAVRLRFTHPVDGHTVEVSAPYPADLKTALEKLRV